MGMGSYTVELELKITPTGESESMSVGTQKYNKMTYQDIVKVQKNIALALVSLGEESLAATEHKCK